MHLLDDVCLIESEIFPPPTVSTFECSSTRAASYELGDSWEALDSSYDRKPLLAEMPGKIVILSEVGETRFKESIDLTVPIPKEHHSVEDRYSRVADS